MGNRDRQANESSRRLAETRGRVGAEVEQRVRELGSVVSKIQEKRRQRHKKTGNGGSLKLEAPGTEAPAVTEPAPAN